jgi:hypothetical protein
MSNRKLYLWCLAVMRHRDPNHDQIAKIQDWIDGNMVDLLDSEESPPRGAWYEALSIARSTGGTNLWAADALRDIVGTPHYQVVWTVNRNGPPSYREIENGDLRSILLMRRHWLTADIVRMAGSAYTANDGQGLPVIADALEEAGCDNEEMLNHLRGHLGCAWCNGAGIVEIGSRVKICNKCRLGMRTIEHVRGCWVVDLLLGRGE